LWKVNTCTNILQSENVLLNYSNNYNTWWNILSYIANAWRAKWTNQIIPIPIVFFVWSFSFYEFVPNIFLLLVQWPPLLLKYKWCVPWVLELFEYNVKCSGAWIDTYFKHKFRGLELANFWHFITMYCHCPQMVFYVLMIQAAFQ
jgi:hypothetical protein